MSYLVEQPPHCDLLRLSLMTGRFVRFGRAHLPAHGSRPCRRLAPDRVWTVVGPFACVLQSFLGPASSCSFAGEWLEVVPSPLCLPGPAAACSLAGEWVAVGPLASAFFGPAAACSLAGEWVAVGPLACAFFGPAHSQKSRGSGAVCLFLLVFPPNVSGLAH